MLPVNCLRNLSSKHETVRVQFNIYRNLEFFLKHFNFVSEIRRANFFMTEYIFFKVLSGSIKQKNSVFQIRAFFGHIPHI